MSLEKIVLEFSADRMAMHCGRVEECVDRLTPEQIWSRNSNNENAIGNLMLHLSGNVRQWILHGVGGAADVRERDAEFAARGEMTAEELKGRLRSTVEEACAVMRSVPAEMLTERRTIQNVDTTVVEAILRVAEHFAHHTGQIIFATKFLTGEDLGFYAHLHRSRA